LPQQTSSSYARTSTSAASQSGARSALSWVR
jgi:hypothetical protein